MKIKYPVILGPLCICSWGANLQLFKLFFVLIWKPEKGAYFSLNGTPDKAIFWLWSKGQI